MPLCTVEEIGSSVAKSLSVCIMSLKKKTIIFKCNVLKLYVAIGKWKSITKCKSVFHGNRKEAHRHACLYKKLCRIMQWRDKSTLLFD